MKIGTSKGAIMNTIARFEGVFHHLMDLLPTVNEQMELAAASGITSSDGQYYQEYRTIGFTSPRQSGKTTWAKDTLDHDPQVSMLIRSIGDKQLLDSAGCHDLDRVMVFSDALDRHLNLPDNTKMLLVDEASHLLRDSERKKKFYDWVADKAPYDLLVVLVG